MATIKFKVLTEMREQKRRRKDLKFGFVAISTESKIVLCSAATNLDQIIKDSFFVMRGCKSFRVDIRIFVEVLNDTKIFQTSPFEYDQDVSKNYLHAPPVSTAEVHGSPQKKRLSVSGEVIQVYPVSYGDDWKRRDVKIGHGTLKCKLWDEFAEKDVRVGSQMSFTNVTVNEYRGTKTVSSSDNTELSCLDEEQNKKTTGTRNIVIDGYNVTGDTTELVTDVGEVLLAPKSLVEGLGPISSLKFPMPIEISAEAGKILKITSVVENILHELDVAN